MKRIVKELLDWQTPLERYVLRAWLIAFIPVFVVGLFLSAFLEGKSGRGASPFVAMVLLAPLVENLLMVGLLKLLSGIQSPAKKSLIVGVIFGVPHALAGLIGIVTIWSFFVFSMTFLGRQQNGFVQAFFVSVAVHALHNLIPALALALL